METNNPTERTMQGSQAIVRFLEERTGSHVFGLPGSSSVAIFYALPSSDLRFVPSLQEGGAMAMADGFARFAGPTGVLLYMVPGVATALSNLYNAWRDETPLVIVASQLTRRDRWGQAHVGEGDLGDIVKPFVRFFREVAHPDQLSEVLEAACRAATGPPAGPALVVVPEDLLTAEVAIPAEFPIRQREGTVPADIQPLIHGLLTAHRPLIVVGGQLRRTGGSDAVENLAEMLEIPITFEPFWNDRLGVSPGHRCSVGQLTDGSSLGAQADFVLALGCRLFNEVHPRRDPWFPKEAFVAHINADTSKVEQTRSTSWASSADPSLVATVLLEACRDEAVSSDLLKERRERLDAVVQRRARPRPGPFMSAAVALGRVLDVAYLVDESVSASFPILSSLQGMRGDRYVSTTGASLGWGIGAACGVALATGEPVVCVLGDGAFFFGAQALWPAVAFGLPITFVVVDNGGFGSTKWYEKQYAEAHVDAEGRAVHFLGSDFSSAGPSVGEVARGFGVRVVQLESGDDLADALDEPRGEGPLLLHVSVAE